MILGFRQILLVLTVGLVGGLVLGVAIGRTITPFSPSAFTPADEPSDEFESGTNQIEIGSDGLKALLDIGTVVVFDVCEPDEYAREHIPGSVSLPLGRLWVQPPDIPRDKAVVVYCDSGLRGDIAARELAKMGIVNARNLSGGLVAWQKAGYQVAQ